MKPRTGDTTSTAAAVVRFGSFVFDLATGELTRQGRRVTLQDQPARVLTLLVQRAGELVTREDLRQALWPEDTFVEFEAAIPVAINKIRRALGDSATNPRFVETIPRHGYRFVADVHPVDAASPGHAHSLAAWMLVAVVLVIVVALSVAMRSKTDVTPAREARRSTASIDAQRWFLEGRWFIERRNERDLRSAVAAFKRATEADPNYALAYAWLANAYGMQFFFGSVPPWEGGSLLVAAAEHALQLDDGIAEAHLASAGGLAFAKWRWREADAGFRRALEINPDYAEGRHWYAVYLELVGRMDDALVQRRRAAALDPQSLLLALGMGDYFLYAREPGRAAEEAEHILRRNPSFLGASVLRARAYDQAGRSDAAIADLVAARDASPGNVFYARSLVSALAGAGHEREARAEVVRVVKRARDEYVSPFEIGLMYAALDDRDAAFHWFGKACDIKDPRLAMIRANARVDRLRPDPRFQALLTCVGLS